MASLSAAQLAVPPAPMQTWGFGNLCLVYFGGRCPGLPLLSAASGEMTIIIALPWGLQETGASISLAHCHSAWSSVCSHMPSSSRLGTTYTMAWERQRGQCGLHRPDLAQPPGICDRFRMPSTVPGTQVVLKNNFYLAFFLFLNFSYFFFNH
jgi:hypothetical protein